MGGCLQADAHLKSERSAGYERGRVILAPLSRAAHRAEAGVVVNGLSCERHRSTQGRGGRRAAELSTGGRDPQLAQDAQGQLYSVLDYAILPG